jgi:hypothetical protein
MKTVSFEEACEVAKLIVTADNFRTIGTQETMRLYKEALDKIGWTLQELLDESKARLRLKIKGE